MSKYSPKRLAGLKTLPKLPGGQKTTAVRVSGEAEVIDWAAGLTPAERGRIFQAAYASRTKDQQEQHAYTSESESKKPKTPKPTAPAAPGGVAPGGAGPAVTPSNADQMRITGHIHQTQAAAAKKKLKAIGDRLPDTETFLRERRKDSRDDD